ncbi:phosphopantothenoylcysteine decarboxylase /phosphopantothenoylcysteine synthetase [Candidatus Symbiothrix dinenymphae]|nr:phosphopantothenoylcysteine decarboxylase /phosphopantothenoylcysteine synthetase [Candidatus Symbiothrix dinenymphae]
MLSGKKIVLGITGSIAAYKAAYLCRALLKRGAEVQVVMTPAAKEFITPVTLAALTQKPVVSEFFTANDGTWHSHVELGLWADLMLIAPATAATIGKMANGIADNMLITTYLSMKAPVFAAPAMDLDMFAHPATQRNLDLLRAYGNHIIEPATGYLASNLEGKGRMEEPDVIVNQIEAFLQEVAGQARNDDGQVGNGGGQVGNDDGQARNGGGQVGNDGGLAKKKILITAGPTYEKIDPVRFIGNFSSGKMGFALAEQCAEQGAEVVLIAGPVHLQTVHPNIRRIDVTCAEEMYHAAVQHFPTMDAAILCAAVADYQPAHYTAEKLKRQPDQPLTLELKPNPDIAAALGQMKTKRQTLIGFALETDKEWTNAREKLKRKNLDFIVLNSLNDEGAGFQADTNKVSILAADGTSETFPLKSKREVAADILLRLTK